MRFRTSLLFAAAICLLASAPTSGQSGLTLTSQTGGAVVPAGQPITVTWTGGDPSASINVVLVDVEAWAVYRGFGLGPNTGSRVVTIAASYGPSGTCGRTFLFYLEDFLRTTWTYGDVFTVVCAAVQPVDSVRVSKFANYVQTSDAPPVIDPRPPGPGYGGPYSFAASVEGSDLAGITPPTVVVPPGSGILHPSLAKAYNGGVLGYNLNDEAWNFGFPFFNNWAEPTAANIDKLFLNGLYRFNVQGAKVELNLSAPVALGPPPAFTLTGGTWIDRKYVVDVRNTVTVTSTPFLGYGANLNGVIVFRVGGDAGEIGEAATFHSEDSAANMINFTIDACQLVGGHDYQGFGSFFAVVDYSTGLPGIPSSENIAFHSVHTGFVISAVGTCDDTTPPVISSLTTSAPTLWPPDHKMVPVTVTAVATDDVSAVTARILSVTSSEPDNGLGDGDTPGDIEITGPMTLKLRAERSGKGSGRVYTILVEAADEAGNTTTGQVQVLVPHSPRK